VSGQTDHGALFDASVWQAALEKFGAATHLTVFLFGADGTPVLGPIHRTPLFTLFDEHGYEPEVFRDCARRCVAQVTDRPAIIVAPAWGLAAVGTSLALEGSIIGAAVAGYAFVDFCQFSAVERLARDAGVPVPGLWEVARTTAPIPEHRLMLHGELLQVLGDSILSILRESRRSRQYEEAAADLKAQAAAKDEFLAVLSHELRTPLTPILNWARILENGADATQITRGVEVIERNALLEARLVEDLLELTRANRGKTVLDLHERDLRAEVRAAVDSTLQVAREQEVALELVASGRPIRVHVDRDRLQQILRNVLSNALKFTPPGGRITVTVRREGGEGTVEVHDTGEGITPSFLPHVFELFRQQEGGMQRRHAGLGIGLALVKRLTELHGGTVMVTSAGINRGTSFTIRLPVMKGAAPAPSRTSTRADLRGLRILVVEDGDDARESTRMLLELLGAEVSVARDGVEGLDVAARLLPDVVLCDLSMPRMDGFEFLRRLPRVSADPVPPVIAITGLAGTHDRSTREAGFRVRLDKPFTEQQILSAVDAALGSTRAA
jgi:signal transduction histidine kinase/CheY-like chemotaxis protein